MADESEVLEYLRSNFAEIQDRLDRIDKRFSIESDDPVQNVPLMIALGRLVVRASKFEEQITDLVTMLSDQKAEKILKTPLGIKLKELASISKKKPNAGQVLIDLSKFCNCVISQLHRRNSSLHSTYLIDEDGVIKWDPRGGFAHIQPDDIQRDADEFRHLTNRAVQYYLEVRDLLQSSTIDGAH